MTTTTKSIPSSSLDSIVSAVSGSRLDRRRHWYVFRAFNLYRLIIAAILLSGLFLDTQHALLGEQHSAFFHWLAIIYLLLTIISLVGSFRRRPRFDLQACLQALVDVVVLAVLSMAAADNSSTFKILLVVAIAGNAILLSMAWTLVAAFLASLLLIGFQCYQIWQDFISTDPSGAINEFTAFLVNDIRLLQTVSLAAALLLTALLMNTLAQRARNNEQKSRQRSQELLEQAQLNQAIVHHLRSGIVVVDRFARVRLLNNTTRQLLNYHAPAEDTPLSEVSPLLSQRLATWLSIPSYQAKPFRQQEHLPDVTPTFSYLSDTEHPGDILILLEDSAQAAQRLQQIKLIALGRLTASIAHEVRNPLASISHAAQLLQESTTINPGDRRLGKIIHDNAKRASTIIANVLDLSRRDKAKPEPIVIKPWLDTFCEEFLRGYGDNSPQINIDVQPNDLIVRFDSGHLRQVLWNLLTNACVHGSKAQQRPRIVLVVAINDSSNSAKPVLDVIDFGSGISELESQRIFEPFFTTKTQGIGLGLYISRDICEANRGQLQYIRTEHGGSCFRISFPIISNYAPKALTAKTRIKAAALR